MRLFTRVIRFRQSFRDHKLRHIDLVLQKVRNDLFRVTGSVETSGGSRRRGRCIGTYAWASTTFLSINILCKHVSMTVETSRQLSRRTVYQRQSFSVASPLSHCPLTSIPFESILSYLSGRVQYNPAYLFLLINRYGK